MDAAPQSVGRYRDRNGELEGVFVRAAGDLGQLLAGQPAGAAAAALVDSLVKNPTGWKAWLPTLLDRSSVSLAEEALRFMSERRGAVPGWITLVRQLADAAGDVDAYRATYTDEALAAPHVAAEMGHQYLAAGRTEDAGTVLRLAAPKAPTRKGRAAEPDPDWESAWIDYLEAAGDKDAAQAVRWASFERALSPDRARAFISRLADFDDVEAETRAFGIAAAHADFEKGLHFLMDWPALADASRMIEARADEIQVEPELAELWAAKLRRRYPKAAHQLLRKVAAAAFRRRDFKTCDRLSAEAETIAGA